MSLFCFFKSRFFSGFFLFFFTLSCLPTEEASTSTSSLKKKEESSNSETGEEQNLDDLLANQLEGLNFGSFGSSSGSSEGAVVSDVSNQVTGNPSDIFWNERFPKTYLTSYLNQLKKNTSTSYMCPPYSFVVGQYSLYHSDVDGREWSDRQYRLRCQYLADGEGRTLERGADSTCVEAKKEAFPSNYKEVYTCPDGKFLSGHVTTFVGDKKMRSHKFACCDIKHPDNLKITFPKYLVYSLEHAGPQKNCKTEADATSYSRRYQWDYECPANSLLYKVTMTNVPETSKVDSYTEYVSKPEDPIFGYECCQVGVQQDANAFIYGYSDSSSSGGLPYELFSAE